jgi:hypothetical protein
MDRCALFVDAGYLLAEGAMAVHGTRHREAVSWDYSGLLRLLTDLARERTALPVLRCYWYEATVEGRHTPDHDTLADMPGLKLRVSRIRPGRREGVDAQVHRDLMTLARNGAICDAVVVSGDEDLAQVVTDAQDLGVRVSVVHIAAGTDWTASRTLRQECDDLIEIAGAQLRAYVAPLGAVESAGIGAHQSSGNGRALTTGAHSLTAAGNGTGSHALTSGNGTGSHALTSGNGTGSHALTGVNGSAGLSTGGHALTSGNGTGAHALNGDHGAYGVNAHGGNGAHGVNGAATGGAGNGFSSPPSRPLPASPRRARSDASSTGALPAYSAYTGETPATPSAAQQPAMPAPLPAPVAKAPTGPTTGQYPSQAPATTGYPPVPSNGGYQPGHSATGGQPAVQQPNAGGYQPGQIGSYTGPQPVQPAAQGGSTTTLADAVKSAHKEGFDFGESVARDAPALWLEAVLARKPRMPSDLEARLLQGSSLPIDFLLHDEVRHALRRGFWDALERARR